MWKPIVACRRGVWTWLDRCGMKWEGKLRVGNWQLEIYTSTTEKRGKKKK